MSWFFNEALGLASLSFSDICHGIAFFLYIALVVLCILATENNRDGQYWPKYVLKACTILWFVGGGAFLFWNMFIRIENTPSDLISKDGIWVHTEDLGGSPGRQMIRFVLEKLGLKQ